MSEIDIVSEQKYEQQFANIFLFLVSVEGFIAFEFTADVGEFLIDTFDLGFFAFACKTIWKI